MREENNKTYKQFTRWFKKYMMEGKPTRVRDMVQFYGRGKNKLSRGAIHQYLQWMLQDGLVKREYKKYPSGSWGMAYSPVGSSEGSESERGTI